MTMDKSIRQEVISLIKMLVKPGAPVTRTAWKVAYGMVRTKAIRETEAWKKEYITIE